MKKSQPIISMLTNSEVRVVGCRVRAPISHHIGLGHCIGNCRSITAVLGLIIWFLMVPPLVNAPWKIDIQAPLKQWNTVRTFETEQECDRVMSAKHSGYKAHATAVIGSINRGTRAFALQLVFSECVSENNPGLTPVNVEQPSS